MDITELLKTVNNIDDYISATEKITSDHSNSKIQMNMSITLALKKIRSIEIEYFTKYNENGAALKTFELMLQIPSSKTWSLLGKELILLIQYWLDAIRKYLILHSINWWSFLSILLKFIEKINTKHLELNNILIEETMEGLLDLATQGLPDVNQKFKIVQCLNSFCNKSSRQIRLAFREKFEDYFIKLSSQMAVCGDIRTQYCIMETLLRWLLPRQDPTVRRDACTKWFPLTLYNNNAVNIFMKLPWLNFFKDAREFLNANNETGEHVTSFLCRRFSIGNVTLISGKQEIDYYVDINCGSKCISLMLEPKMQEILCSPKTAYDALIIQENNIENIQLHRKFPEIEISVKIVDPSKMHSSIILQDCDVTLVISSKSNLKKINKALRNIFNTKYQLLIDIDGQTNVHNVQTPRQRETCQYNNSEEDTRFSHPMKIQRKKHSGYISRNKHCVSWQSPSTASTSSLALLKDKLTVLPGYRFNKVPTRICVEPDLSCVTEFTEVTEVTGSEENIIASNTQSTLKLNNFGVCNRKVKKNDKIKSQRDIDVSKEQNKCGTPINNDNENSVSCLLVATIGSADDSVINDTIEHLSKNKEIPTNNIVDLLTSEALQFQSDNSNYKNIDKINNNIVKNIKLDKLAQKKRTIVSNTTTDESNAEVYEDTPNILNVPKGRVAKTVCEEIEKSNTDKQTYDKQAVDRFFLQHLLENRNGDIVSPTLARKINETSSESSESFDFPITNMKFNFSEVEIVKCLNDIVDKVCKDFDKYSESLNDNLNTYENDVTEVYAQMPLNEFTNKTHNTQSKENTPKIKIKDRSRKLSFQKTKPNRKKINKLDIENVNRMYPIKESERAVKKISFKENNPEKPEKKSDCTEYDTLIRRKRKLYSPKDDTKVNEKVGIHISETEEDTVPSAFKVYDKTPKSIATSYKEIDTIRKDSLRRLRNKSQLRESVSPRTKKMNDIFDNLKKNEDGQEKIMLANEKTRNKKLAMYNLSSDSEEKEQNIKLKKSVKKSSITSLGSVELIKHRGIRRSKRLNKVNNSETKLNETENVNKTNTKPKTVRTRANTKKIGLKSRPNLEDQCMRDTVAGLLNTSLVIEEPRDNITEVEPVIKKPEMETIIDEVKQIKKHIKKNLSLKKRKIDNKFEKHSDQDSESSLPVLMVEKAQVHREADDSVKSVLLDNLKNISQFNTSQNLLEETNNRSPPKLNITDEFNKINSQTDTPKQNTGANNKSKTKRYKPKKLSNDSDDINKTKAKVTKIRKLSIVSHESDKVELMKDNSDITIATVGRSPITARGDLEGSPPNIEQLNQPVTPRNLDVEDLNKSTQAYFEKLTLQLNSSLRSRNKSSGTNEVKTKTNIDSQENLETIVLNKSPSVSIARLSPQEMRQWQPTRMNSVFGSSVTSETSLRITRSKSKNSRNETGSNPTESKQIRKSLISPIQMLGETDIVISNLSKSDDYVTPIRGMMTRKFFQSSSPKSLQSSKSDENITKDNKSSTISKQNSKISSKRKASSPKLSVAKIKKKNGESNIRNQRSFTREVSVSSSNIQEWFKRNDRENLGGRLNQSLKELIEQTMEKLATTLDEINHATSKKFVNMFVDAYRDMKEMKTMRKHLYRETKRNLKAQIVKIVDKDFADLEKKLQEFEDHFIENLKQKSTKLIREDSKYKRTMMMLLQEDLQAQIVYN